MKLSREWRNNDEEFDANNLQKEDKKKQLDLNDH